MRRKSGQNEMHLKQHKAGREKERREGEKTKEKRRKKKRWGGKGEKTMGNTAIIKGVNLI